MRLEGNNEAEEGDNSGSAGGVGLVGGALEGSGLLTNASARGNCGLGGSAVAVGSLNLTVGDLGNRADGGSSLDLAVGDLRNSSASGGSGAGLDLAVGDLGDGSAGGSGGAGLDLTVGNLAHGSTGCASLDLTIGDLGDRSADGGSLLGLSVGKLRSSSSGTLDDVNVDLVALVASGVVVEVVEVAAQALVEDGGATEGKGAVAASRPASSVDGASLRRTVELELVVGRNVTSTVLGVGEDTILESDLKLHGVGLLPLVQGALGGGLSDVDDLDLEVAVVTRGATRGSRRAGLDVVGDTLSDGRGNDSGRKGDRGSDGVAHVGGC
jgi:hypothetical protein